MMTPTLAEVISKMWEDNLGIQTTITTVEWQVHISEMKNLDIQIAMGGWTGDYQHPTTFLDMYTANSGNNYTGWHSDEYDALMQQAAAEQDQEKAAEMYIQAEKMLLDEQIIVPLYYGTYNMAVNPALKDWSQSAIGMLRFKYAHFE